MKKNLLLLMALCFCALANKALGQTYSGGSGTESDPYLISSKADMEELNTTLKMNRSYNYSVGKYFLLTQDLTDIIYPIGDRYGYGGNDVQLIPFSGTFDGGGHVINVNINTSYYAGAFGYANGGTIKNLKVTGNITNTSFSYTQNYIGGICGYADDNTIITNCSNTGNLFSNFNIQDYSPYTYIGGICGYATDNTSITNCSNAGNIGCNTTYFSCFSAGGICGHIENNATIANCLNKGNIDSYSTGGICGFISGLAKIYNCIALNTSISGVRAARITIDAGGSIENCYALASMLVNGSTVSSQDANSTHGKDIDNFGNIFNMDFSTCSQSETMIMLSTVNTIKWQRSNNNEQSWTDIDCTYPFYMETAPVAGQYIYRALNGDGTYSNYMKGVYSDAVPSDINTLPMTSASMRVDDSNTFTLELTDDNYNYQWYKGNVAITGATDSTYSIPALKMEDAGIYHCQVWNDCNEVASSNTTLIMDKATQVITLPATTMTKAYGDADFLLPGTTNKNLTIAYSSSNTSVATVTDNQVHIVGLGATVITASQAGNSEYIAASPVTLSLTVTKGQQTITFGALPEKTYSDPAFALSASVNTNHAINYESSNTNVATISGNTLTIQNAGTVTITAFVAGDEYYDAATPVQQQLTVNKAPLTATAGNNSRLYGDDNPAFTITYSGFKSADSQSSISQAPTASCKATPTSTVGNYPIALSGGEAQNYNFVYQNGTLTINKAPLTIAVDNVTRPQGQPNPTFTFSYLGFKNNENHSLLDELPIATCAANENSAPGNYTIFLSGGYDDNYNYTLVNGTLEVTLSTGIEDVGTNKTFIFPNPAKDEINIKSDSQIKKVEIYSSTGALQLSENNFNGKISVSALLKGVYIVKVYTDKGLTIEKIVKE